MRDSKFMAKIQGKEIAEKKDKTRSTLLSFQEELFHVIRYFENEIEAVI